jgi:hypothetical protein
VNSEHQRWWALQPIWLKLAFAFIAVPSWSYIMFGDLVRRRDDSGDAIAFGLFFTVTLSAMWVQWRNRKDAGNG